MKDPIEDRNCSWCDKIRAIQAASQNKLYF